MARLKNLPSLEIIKGFKGVIDYAVYRGVPIARSWPHTPREHLTAATLAAASIFGEVVSAFRLLYPPLLALLTQEAADQTRSARDVYVQATYGYLHENAMTDILSELQSIDDHLALLEEILHALASVATDQVRADIISSALPAGAATQTTLAALLAKLDVALSTRALEAGGNLADIKTAAQLIDDLRNALGSVNTDDLQVDVKTSALPSGAATQTTLASILSRLDVALSTRALETGGNLADIKTALQIIDGFALATNKIYGYYDRYAEKIDWTMTAAAEEKFTTAVPAGEIWLLNSLSIRNVTGAATNYTVAFCIAAVGYVTCAWASAYVQWQPLYWNGSVVLKEGDKVSFYVSSAAAGEAIEARVWGYKMKIA